MLSVADLVYLIITSALSVATVMFYFMYLLEKRFANTILLIIPTILGLIVPTFCLLKYKNSELNFIISILLILFITLFFKPIKRGLFYVAILIVIMLLAEGMVFCTLSIFSVNIYGHLPQFITYTFTALLSYLFAKRFKFFNDIDLPIEYSIAFMSVPVCSIGILYVVYALFLDNLITSAGTIVIVVIVYILNIVSIFMYSKIVNYFVLRVNNKALSCQIEAYVEKQNQYAEAFKNLYTLQHNMKNELLPVSTMLESGEYDTAHKRINDTLGNYNVIQYVTYTKINLLDDMLNYKRFAADSQSVQFLVHSNVTRSLNINYIDLSIVIGIALDNAIEETIKSVNREVKIEIYTNENAFIVDISNFLTHSIERDKNGDILSTKNDGRPHGIGLMSIKTLIEKNNGEQRILVQDGMFKITFILFETDMR